MVVCGRHSTYSAWFFLLWFGRSFGRADFLDWQYLASRNVAIFACKTYIAKYIFGIERWGQVSPFACA
jgi:hypothetical protein